MWPSFLRRQKQKSPVGLGERLADWRYYEAEIENLHRRYLFTRQLYELRQDDVSLATIIMEKAKVAKLLARSVQRGDYRFEPGRRRPIVVNGKERIIYAFRLTDLIVARVVTKAIEEALAPRLSDALFSYRKGVSWHEPVSGLAAYAREHRRARPDPRTRGLYVLRRDIQKYADSIPVDENAPVWPMLRGLLEGEDGETPISVAEWALVQQAVRPVLGDADGCEFQLVRGVPTGQPIGCVLFNLYLSEFDHVMGEVPGAFYARYSDDFLFAHPDAETTRRVSRKIDEMVAGLGICANQEKDQNIFLNGAGRPSSDWTDAVGATRVPFLGCTISADGTVALTREKQRLFLRDLEERARRTAQAMRGEAPDKIGRAICAAINQATHPRRNVFPLRSAALLRRAVTDREQLEQLDYLVARSVAGVVSGEQSVKAFRRVPYRRIRGDWKLLSLYHARNQWGRGRGQAS